MTLSLGFGTRHTAVFSPCRKYRYRIDPPAWDVDRPRVCMCLLNPSKASEEATDRTFEKGKRYARAWGFGSLVFVNAFALMSTDPNGLYEVDDPVGPFNDHHIVEAACASQLVVCAWGVHGGYRDRDRHVLDILRSNGVKTMCLTVTKEGFPGHILYLPKALRPIEYVGRDAP